MAVELISQILSPENAPYVNGVAAQLLFSKAIIANAFQKLIEKDAQGVNDAWVTEDQATTAAQVFVHRVKPVPVEAREQGASKNGASFSADQHYTETETVGIELLQWVDDPIIVPRARQDMIPTDLVSKDIENWSGRLATLLNGATAASKLVEVWKADAEGYEVNSKNITATDIANKEAALRFMEANSLLDEGDIEHGLDMFPEDTRIAIVKVGYRPILKAAGVLVIGGANDAYEILRKGGIDKDANPTKMEDGYIGEIDGVPCHVISNLSLQYASTFLGLPENELKDSPFIGYLASSYANARGVSVAERIKTVDAQFGQGVIIQPYCKFGVKTFYQKGVVTLQSADYNPLKALKTLFSGADITFKLKGKGSRLYPAGGTWVIGATGFTLSGVTANDDWNNDHVEAAAYFVGTAPVKSVSAFSAGYASATYKGSVTIGSAVSTTIADTQYVNVLVVSDDGSVSLFSKQYNA